MHDALGFVSRTLPLIMTLILGAALATTLRFCQPTHPARSHTLCWKRLKFGILVGFPSVVKVLHRLSQYQ